jgi:hypothetical protein
LVKIACLTTYRFAKAVFRPGVADVKDTMEKLTYCVEGGGGWRLYPSDFTLQKNH